MSAVAETGEGHIVVRFAPILGQAMKTLRERSGLSQEQLARRVDGYMSRETIRRIESGRETTTASIDRVLAAMECNAGDLLREIDATRVKLQGRLRRTPLTSPIQPPLVAAR